ncbi:MAG: hypothetical protein QM652_01230 [Legionella sp.]|uniref:hypothetical protein n=1 Tax=Legionella sp. TaxID=459 RepID=UPI0039E3335B
MALQNQSNEDAIHQLRDYAKKIENATYRLSLLSSQLDAYDYKTKRRIGLLFDQSNEKLRDKLVNSVNILNPEIPSP